MKHTFLTTFIFSLLLAGCATQSSKALEKKPGATAQPAKTTLAASGRDPAEFPAYVEQLKNQARAKGIDQATLDAAFNNIHFVDRAISSDRNQLEKKITLDDYLARVLPEAKKQRARENFQQYQASLQPVSQRYGVQPQYIVALWAMESNFGKIQGREEVISALATLAFEGRREAFFTKELLSALQIIQQQHIDAGEMKGSWAGAMGQNQFMPSSFLRYGADGDGDGRIDIWNDTDDVFASTANYLATEGWKPGQSWGQEVTLPAGFAPELGGLKTSQAKTVAEWQSMGVQINGTALPDATQRAWIIMPDDAAGRAFMVYDNFRVIMHWNRSYYFAISIGMMADAIAQQDGVR
ncbi:lytic murein transglycosylase [Erwinia phyllosphaerae]|uniref:lytic murein transglycosylase n=1 Tax=Erwinia phyllosphaerae TaxID=2853256 RepID=UPI001FF0199C|nr:lytic murein transglycosylase [Erwinia phyllosphaerae]MBV4365045.1 lytic murein transglycosylase [Erwinia phyllosphaerae]